MQVSRDDARSVHALCYDKNDTREVISIAYPKLRGADQTSLHILRRPTSEGQLGQISGSRALFYSVYDNTIYIFNQLDPDDVTHLNDLVYWGILDRETVAKVIATTKSFSPPCPAPVSDQGVTESYWATKGTAVLHHWAFLYDVAVSDGKPVRAQYGFLVGRMAATASRSFERGPTGFVRSAWVIFCCIGVVYSVAFMFVFRRNVTIAVAGLCWQIALYASIGAFSLLLAPGYHWSRELVMVLPPLFLATLGTGGGRRNIYAYSALALVMCVSAVALDPSFAIVSFGCLGLALATVYWRTIRTTARDRPILLLILVASAVAILGAGVIADGSNLFYIVSKTTDYLSAALADRGRDAALVFNVVAAAIVLGLCAWHRLSTIAAYYGFISIVSYQYFIITPDQFHWAKYEEFVVPIYVVLGTVVYAWVASLRYLGKIKKFVDAGILVVALVSLTNSYRSITAMPPNWELRVIDSVGAPYFSSTPVEINGRTIDANINEDTIQRLKSFPSSRATDLIVSPLDKYVLFLYDEHNGFPVIDETAWMDSDTKLSSMEMSAQSKHLTATIDNQVFLVNPTAGLLSTNSTMGDVNSQSLLSVKSRIRMSEFAAFLVTHCMLQSSVSTWEEVRC